MEEHNNTHNGSYGGKNDNFLAISILIGAVLVSGSLIYSSSRQAPAAAPTGGAGAPTGQANPPADLSKVLAIGGRDVILGDPKAPVTIIEYADYQCPFCGRFFSQVAMPLRDDYIKSGKVKMVYRDFVFLGQESMVAAEAAECAKDQSKFWPFHDALHLIEIADTKENNGNIDRALVVKVAKDVGMDVKAFGECYDAHKYAQAVQDTIAAARSAGVSATPTTFVNGQMVQGAQPYAQFKAAIDAALAK